MTAKMNTIGYAQITQRASGKPGSISHTLCVEGPDTPRSASVADAMILEWASGNGPNNDIRYAVSVGLNTDRPRIRGAVISRLFYDLVRTDEKIHPNVVIEKLYVIWNKVNAEMKTLS